MGFLFALSKLYVTFSIFNNFICPVMLSIPIEYSSIFSASNDPIFPELKAFKVYKEKNTNFSGHYNGELVTSYGTTHFDEYAQAWDISKLLSYETVWPSGRRVTTNVKVNQHTFPSLFEEKPKKMPTLNISTINEAIKKHRKKRSARRRKRRMVYGADDRFYIPVSIFGNKQPYSSSVRISSGCTGVLVSPRHVLTAAHCVHDQKDFVEGIKDLKVGLLESGSKWTWIDVQNLRISKGWVDGDRITGPCFDYALLRLRKRHNRPYLGFSVSPEGDKGIGERIYFTSFEDDKPQNTMWYRSCSIEADDSHFVYHFCDAWKGSSGSGVYAWQFNKASQKWQRQLIGIFTGNRWLAEDDWFLTAKNFNAAVKITPSKYVQLCKWMGKYGKRLCSHTKDGQLTPRLYYN